MTALGQLNAGSRLTASEVRGVAPLAAYKIGDQSSPASTTALFNDTALVIPVAASAVYKVELLLYYTGGTHNTSDLKVNFTAPSGASSQGVRYLGLTPAALAVQYGQVVFLGALAFGSNGTSNIVVAELAFTLATSTTPGSLQLQWAQNTSSATVTTVKAGSSILAWQIQ